MHIPTEVAAESEWVAKHLEEFRHELMVANPELHVYERLPAARENRSTRLPGYGMPRLLVR